MMFARTFLRIVAVCALFSTLSWAQPTLTTISDVLFKADGTRLNGLAQITWMTFESSNGSYIAQQTKTIRIIDGNLFAQLTPTTTAVPQSVYSVKYSSDGKIQFQETWAVPPSTVKLRVRDVRTTDPAFPGSGGIGQVTQIQESDVLGLVADLSIRAQKGPGYSNSRAAVINDTGQVEGALGSASDCVKVDGTSGPCGSGGSANFVDLEVPSGVVDGSNAAFTLANLPSPAASLHLFRNGLVQKPGFDFTLANATVTFVTSAIPQPGDTILASYRR
jgi:hypothetical protein